MSTQTSFLHIVNDEAEPSLIKCDGEKYDVYTSTEGEPDASDRKGNTPLLYANGATLEQRTLVQNVYTDMVKTVFDVDTDKSYKSALISASFYGIESC